ncbi:MAG: enolase C-terminal domain-like protein [Saprospiraceae bacterium]
MKRRNLFKNLLAASAATALPFQNILAKSSSPKMVGLGEVKITDIKTILTAPNGIKLVVVKVMTSEPGLYGIGCATFTQRAYVVATALEKYLKPFLMGRNVDEIEDIWQSSYVSSYWRNGPALFNAMSGVDMALWDIKGKRANMPVYQLLGGKVRMGADLYYHASGLEFSELDEKVQSAIEAGYRHVRIQMGQKGNANYGARGVTGTPASSVGLPPEKAGPTDPKIVFDPAVYARHVPKMFEHIRTKFGEEVELLHDMHERVPLTTAVSLCKELEQYHPYFIEDPLPPEDNEHFRIIRQHSTVPIAMGELFNTQQEYLPLIKEKLIDFIRIHISQIGGLSPARKVQALCEFFGVKTAWHGPGDASPIAHAAQLALELCSYNFGVHEGGAFPENTKAVFPGCPETKNGYLFANDKPGLGMDIDEKIAAKFPYPDGPNFDYSWGTTRRKDGTVIRP